MYVYILHACSARGAQKRARNPLGLALQVFVWVLGNEPMSSAASALAC